MHGRAVLNGDQDGLRAADRQAFKITGDDGIERRPPGGRRELHVQAVPGKDTGRLREPVEGAADGCGVDAEAHLAA
jgi:hypothetical protein